MKKIILSLFVAFSLLVAPIAHAAGVGCQGDNCQMSEQVKKHSDSKKQDNDKMAKAGHHCCCPHVSAIPDLAIAEPTTASSQTVFVLEQDVTTSVVVGPPLKPPSHA
jgi:Ni/Co efflux regulator RcnB